MCAGHVAGSVARIAAPRMRWMTSKPLGTLVREAIGASILAPMPNARDAWVWRGAGCDGGGELRGDLAAHLRGALAQHVLQDAAVDHVLDLLRCIDARDHRERLVV